MNNNYKNTINKKKCFLQFKNDYIYTIYKKHLQLLTNKR